MNERNYLDFGDSCSLVYPPEDFEGVWVEYWPNGKLKYRGRFQKGRMRVGQHFCLWESGTLQEVSYWNEGWVTGTLIRFERNGAKQFERDYGQHGGKNRDWIQREYGVSSGRLMSITLWHDDQIVTVWEDPESRRIWEEIGGDEIVARAVRRMQEPD